MLDSTCRTEQDFPSLLAASTAARWLSETRVELAPEALRLVNQLLSGILECILTASVLPAAPSTWSDSLTPRRPRTAHDILSKPLANSEILCRDRWRAGTLVTLGGSMGAGAVVEAEIALGELLQRGPPSLRSDGALKRYGGRPGRHSELTPIQKDAIYRSLRSYVGLLSSTAQHSPSLVSHISSLLPLPAAPTPRNDHITFITAFYAERVIAFVSQAIVRRIARILERESSKDSASVEDVLLSLSEDDSLWIWEKKAKGYIGKAASMAASTTSFDKLIFSTAPTTKKITLTPSFFSRQDHALRSRYEPSSDGQLSSVAGQSGSKRIAGMSEEEGFSTPMSHQESDSSGGSTLGRHSDGNPFTAEGRSPEPTAAGRTIKGFLAKVTTRRSGRPSAPVTTSLRPLQRFPSSNGILVVVGSELPTFSTPPLPPTPSPPTPSPPTHPLTRIRQPLSPVRPPPFIRISRDPNFPPTSIHPSIAESVLPIFSSTASTSPPIPANQRTAAPHASPSTRVNNPSLLLSAQSTTALGIRSRNLAIEEVPELGPTKPATSAKERSTCDDVRVLKRGASYRSAIDAVTETRGLEDGHVSAVRDKKVLVATTRPRPVPSQSATRLISTPTQTPSIVHRSLPSTEISTTLVPAIVAEHEIDRTILQGLRMQMASAATAQECLHVLDKLIRLTQASVDSPPISPIIPASVPLPRQTPGELASLAEQLDPPEQPTDSTRGSYGTASSAESEARDLRWVVELYLG